MTYLFFSIWFDSSGDQTKSLPNSSEHATIRPLRQFKIKRTTMILLWNMLTLKTNKVVFELQLLCGYLYGFTKEVIIVYVTKWNLTMTSFL